MRTQDEFARRSVPTAGFAQLGANVAPLLDARLLRHLSIRTQGQQRLYLTSHTSLFAQNVPSTNKQIAGRRRDTDGFGQVFRRGNHYRTLGPWDDATR